MSQKYYWIDKRSHKIVIAKDERVTLVYGDPIPDESIDEKLLKKLIKDKRVGTTKEDSLGPIVIGGNEDLKSKIAQLSRENADYKKQISEMESSGSGSEELTGKIETLTKEGKELTEKNETMVRENETITEYCDQLCAQIRALDTEPIKLESDDAEKVGLMSKVFGKK